MRGRVRDTGKRSARAKERESGEDGVIVKSVMTTREARGKE